MPKKHKSREPAVLKWEYVVQSQGSDTHRLKVPGGWIYRETSRADDGKFALGLVFVPRRS